MSVSPKRQARKSVSQTRAAKSARQNWMKRMLRLEALEQRQLMASDVTPFHNSLIANDVNGDFSISPLDALVIINKLNSEGSGSLAGKTAPSDRSELVDVDGDNSLSPLDALNVINALNSGEGEAALVELQYKFFSVNADGTAGTELPDPIPDNGKPDAVIGTGDRVIVRTLVKDLRPGQPLGVFSAYHDLSFTNADGSSAEELQLQWGEFDQLDIQNNVRGGTFTLTYGSETTAPISVAFSASGIYNSTQTGVNIRNAIQALPSVGAGNVKVTTLTSSTTFRFGINFIGSKARTDFVNPVVGSNNLNDAGSGAVSLNVTGQTSPSPTDDTTARVARNHSLDNGTFVDGAGQTVNVIRYTNGQSGTLTQASLNSPTRTMSLLGGFSSGSDFLDPTVASTFLNVVDVLFKGGAPGVINFAGHTSPLPLPGQSGDNLGLALFGAQAAYLTENVVVLPTGTLTIADRLTAIADVQTVAEDSGATNINVTANDIDRFGTSRSVIAVTQPAQGGTVGFSGNNVIFTPSPDFNGTAIFTYTIRNNVTPTPDTAVGTVTVTVTPVNDPPTVKKSAFTVAEDPASPLVILPTDIFSPGPADEASQTITLSNVVTTSATHGTVTLTGGNINFTPDANFFGTAVFTVTGTDVGTATDPAKSTVANITVTVTPVNDAPVPFNGTLTVAEDGSLILIGAGAVTDILSNSNPGPGEAPGQTVRLISIQSPTAQGGTITTVGGVTTYRPAADYFGPDSFTYRISDDASPNLEAVGTVTINVTPVNDAPRARNDSLAVLGISAPNSLNVMLNDDAGPLEVNDTITIKSVTTPTLGTATFTKDRVIYTPPNGNFQSTATFSYTIEDSLGLTSTAQVSVLILPPILPFALADTYTVAEDSGAFTADVIANDFGNSGATKRLVPPPTQPANGTVTVDDRGTPADTSDDRLVFTPAPNFFGTTEFTYTMTDDASGSVPSTATVTMIVTPVNDPPVAADRTASTLEDNVLPIQANLITDGLDRGPGESAQSLTISDVTNLTANSGTVAISAGNILYTPAKDFNGQVLVRYTVTDSGTPPLSASATLTITVAPVNDPPVVGVDPAVVTSENSSVTIAISTLTANDTPGPANESGQTVSFVALVGALTTANGGTVTQNGVNLVYTPAPSFNGQDTVTYQITDGQSTLPTSTATLTFTVSEVNDVPTASTLTRSVFASVPTIFNLTDDLKAMPKGPANESGQTLRVTRVIPGSKGSVVLNSDGTITYTAPLGASGQDTFTYEVTDNGTTNGVADPKTATGTFIVNISPFIPSDISGIVYIDDDANGITKSTEFRLGGVEVTLSIPATATTPARSITQLTETDGSYAFTLLPPGEYTVSFAVPEMMLDSTDIRLAGSANSHTVSVVAPGNIHAVHDFAVLGTVANYGSILENLASNYYATNGAMRTEGLYAAIGADGKSAWTITRGGFAGDRFEELVLSNDRSVAYLTSERDEIVNGVVSHNLYTATIDKSKFVSVKDSTGATLVRVLATSSDLVWQKVSLAAPPVVNARGYLKAIDDFFVGEGWK